ncbi:MAG: DNA-directed RNA polymerase subunit N [Candidatus Wukongarchaeota archaeon]|jgi:DNA-directed RNA polymerase subunit N|nr:DNA-directed RNA polymerase subunit N [Candidatus Wukongarchaeota archaeon]
MEIPIRCFTCGNLIADKFEEFAKRLKKGEEPNKILDDLGLKRYCCRTMIITHIEIIGEISRF